VVRRLHLFLQALGYVQLRLAVLAVQALEVVGVEVMMEDSARALYIRYLRAQGSIAGVVAAIVAVYMCCAQNSGPQFSPTLSLDIILPPSSSNRPLDSSTYRAISQPSRDALTSFVFSLPCSGSNDECCRHQPPQFCHRQ
jgi:hypothetical protein